MRGIVDNNIKMTLGSSMIVYGVIENILYEDIVDSEGKTSRRERLLPFRLKYRLTRAKATLEKDLKYVDAQKLYLLAQYGEIVEKENGLKDIEIKDEGKLKEYKDAIYNLLNQEIEHTLMQTEREDLDTITAKIDVSAESLKIFIGYMTNDPLLMEDLNKKITPTEEEVPTTEEVKS